MVHQTPICWGNPQSPDTSGRCHNLPYEKVGKNEPVCIADEVPFEIPESWEWVHPTDIGYFSSGRTPKVNELSSDGKIPYFKVSDMNTVGNEVYLSITKSFLTHSVNSKTFEKNTVVYPKNGGAVFTNKKRILSQQSLVDLNTGTYTPYKPINSKFFYYLFQTIDFQNYYKGSALPTVDTEKIKKIVWGLPPFEEQARIVLAIEKVLPLIDAYNFKEKERKTLNSTFPLLLKKSIFQEAVQGKLVPQDPTDEPASVLLDRIRAEKEQLIKSGKIKRDKHESVIFRRDNSYYERVDGIERCIDDEIPFEIPDNWCWARIKSCIDVRDGTHDTPKYVEHGIPLITSKNLSNGYLDFSTAKLISLEDHLSIKQRSKVDDGDILFAMIGSIGNPVLYHGNQEFSIKNMALFKKITNNISMDYAYIFFEYAQTYMKKDATGGVQAFVSLNYLRNYLIPIPPQKEQIRIYNAVTQLHKKIDYMA